MAASLACRYVNFWSIASAPFSSPSRKRAPRRQKSCVKSAHQLAGRIEKVGIQEQCSASWEKQPCQRSSSQRCQQSSHAYQGHSTASRRRSAGFVTRAGADGVDPEEQTWDPPGGKRKVVEHVTLYQMRKELTEEAEKEMLDHLWSLQYKFREMLATSVGRIYSKRSGGYTHALYARFPNQASAENYEYSPASLTVLQNYVQPFCEDSLSLNFEANVENDVEAVFRRGDDWNVGEEHIVLLKVKEGTPEEAATSLLKEMEDLQAAVGSSVVQLTIGPNSSRRSKGYTHGMVVRCPSEDDLAVYNKHPKHREVLRKKVLPICDALLSVDYSIDPIGERLM